MARRFSRPILAALASAIFSAAFAQSSGLTSAHSFEVDETLAHSAHLTVDIIRPNKVKVTLSNNHGQDGTYVCDGDNAYEYHQWSKTWQKLELASDDRYPSVLLDLGAVDLLLAGGKLPRVPGETQTTTTETLNGHEAILTTNLGQAKTGRDGVPYQNEMKLWTDATTGLPLRRVEGVISKGAEHIYQDLAFDDFKFNVPLEIAWQAPEGSKEDAGIPFLPPGSAAPNFSLKTSNGKTVSLADFRGKVVILDFWATWCGPCQRAMPHLEKVYNQLKERDVVVLGVCVWDQKDAYDQWVARKKGVYTFQTLFDPAGKGKDSVASKLYSVQAIPTQYVIDKSGKIVAGYIPGSTKADPLVAALKRAGEPLNN